MSTVKNNRLADELEQLQLRALKTILERIAGQLAVTLRPMSNAPDSRPDSVLTTRPKAPAKQRRFLKASDGSLRSKKGKNPSKKPRALA